MDNHKTRLVASLTSHFDSINVVDKRSPTCGVKAKKLKSKKLSNFCQTLLSSNKITNTSTTSDKKSANAASSIKEADPRPDNEYDVPWDSENKRKINRSISIKEELKQFVETREDDVSGAGTHRSIGSHSSTDDSGVYEEPWESCNRSNRYKGRLKVIAPAPSSYCSSNDCISKLAPDEKRPKGSCQILCQSSPINSCVSSQKSRFCCSESPMSLSSFDSKNSASFDEGPKVVDQRVKDCVKAFNAQYSPTAANDIPPVEDSIIKIGPRLNPQAAFKRNGTFLSIPLINEVQNSTMCGSSNNRNFLLPVSEVNSSTLAPNSPSCQCVANSKSVENENVYDAPWESSLLAATSARSKDEASIMISGDVAMKKRSEPRSRPVANRLNSVHSAGKEPQPIDFSFESEAWYHGDITRSLAEDCLKDTGEGSFLVRSCEGSQSVSSGDQDYALSLRNAGGFLHLKIQLNDQNRWVLGYFSYPFDSVSQMISFYSRNKLPIKGTEHICLGRPVLKELPD